MATTGAASGGPNGERRSQAEEKEEQSRRRANRWARVGATLVATLGLVLVFLPILEHGQHWTTDPDEPRTTTSSLIESQFGGVVTTTVVKSKAGTTTTSVSRSPSPDTKLTLSSGEQSRSLLERAFGAGGFFLFRLALVAVAAFLTGAIVQRTWLARFAIKFPFLELSDLNEAAAASADAIKEIRDYVDDQIKTVVGASADAITALRGQLDHQIETVVHLVDEELERRK